MSVPHFEATISFTCEKHMKKTAFALLQDDMMWSFTVTPSADSAIPHTIEIHDTPWGENMGALGDIVSKACQSKEQSGG